MNRIEQVKAFVNNHKTEILVASGVLAGAVIGVAGLYVLENRDLYKMKRVFRKWNLEHENKAELCKNIAVKFNNLTSDEEFDEAYKIACDSGCHGMFDVSRLIKR